VLAVLLVHTATLQARLAALLATVRREADSVRTLQMEERERVFETSNDLILVTDTAGTFIQVSPSSMSIIGYQPAEMIGHSAVEFIHPTISKAPATRCDRPAAASRSATS